MTDLVKSIAQGLLCVGLTALPLALVHAAETQASRAGAVRLSPSTAQLAAGITMLNRGDASVWRTTSVQGTPSVPLAAEHSGFTLTKTIWTMGGAPADHANLHQVPSAVGIPA